MTDIVRVPEQAAIGLKDAPWVAALEPLARTLPYDIAVAAGGVPTDELANVDIPVLVIGGANSPAWFQRSVAEQAAAVPAAAGDAGWVRPQCAAGGARPHPGRVLHRGTLTPAPWTAVLKCFTYALTSSDVR